MIGIWRHKGKPRKIANVRVAEGRQGEFEKALIELRNVFATSGQLDALEVSRSEQNVDQYQIVLLGQSNESQHEEIIVKAYLSQSVKSLAFWRYDVVP